MYNFVLLTYKSSIRIILPSLGLIEECHTRPIYVVCPLLWVGPVEL